MAKYVISHGSWNGRIHFTDVQWKEIETVAKLAFNAEQRGNIQLEFNKYLIELAPRQNELLVEDIDKPLANIVECGEKIYSFLTSSLDPSTASGTALNLLKRSHGNHDLSSAWHQIADLLTAAKKARTTLKGKASKGKRGPVGGEEFDRLICRLGALFENAGGRASVGTRRKTGIADFHGSAFSDFVHTAYLLVRLDLEVMERNGKSYLPKLIEMTSVAVAERIHRLRKATKMRGQI